MEQFKIRASACGKIVGENGLTENQLSKLAELSVKEKLTIKQSEELAKLIFKRDNPELPQTVKTYCKMWLKGKIFNRHVEFSNKYTEKGNICEDNSLDFIADQLGYGMLMKNDRHFNDEFMNGTPDVVLSDLIIDVKNSWSWETFPTFETEIPNTDYYYQLQVYMHLTERKNAKLIYVLSDTPENLIERDARYYCNNNGFDFNDADVFEQFKMKMTYGDIDAKDKIKVYDIAYDSAVIEKIIARVKECREFIGNLLNERE